MRFSEKITKETKQRNFKSIDTARNKEVLQKGNQTSCVLILTGTGSTQKTEI